MVSANIAIVNVQLEFNYMWQKQTMNKDLIKIQFRKKKFSSGKKKKSSSAKKSLMPLKFKHECWLMFFILTSKMKVKQQRCLLGRHSFDHDASNFFAHWIIVFNNEKNISSNFCIIHK